MTRKNYSIIAVDLPIQFEEAPSTGNTATPAQGVILPAITKDEFLRQQDKFVIKAAIWHTEITQAPYCCGLFTETNSQITKKNLDDVYTRPSQIPGVFSRFDTARSCVDQSSGFTTQTLPTLYQHQVEDSNSKWFVLRERRGFDQFHTIAVSKNGAQLLQYLVALQIDTEDEKFTINMETENQQRQQRAKVAATGYGRATTAGERQALLADFRRRHEDGEDYGATHNASDDESKPYDYSRR